MEKVGRKEIDKERTENEDNRGRISDLQEENKQLREENQRLQEEIRQIREERQRENEKNILYAKLGKKLRTPSLEGSAVIQGDDCGEQT